MMRGVKAVLFDLDETIIDARDGFKMCHLKVADRLHSYLKENGVSVKASEIFSRLRDLDDRMNRDRKYNRNAWWPPLLQELGVDRRLPPDFLDELTHLFWDTFADGTKPYPDAVPLLEHLKKKGYGLGLVSDTDGTAGFKRRRLDRIDMMKYFGAVVIAGEDTPRPKPDPAGFLLAAERLGVRPGDCVMVGDKPFTDIRGGKAAGMRTILVKRRDWGVEERPDVTVTSLSEIRGIL